MKDYLDNLIAKSLGPAEAVRPRPPSLFEPRPPTGPFAPHQLLVENESEPGPPSLPPAPDAEASEPPPSRRKPSSGPPAQHPDQAIARGPGQFTLLQIPHQPALPAPAASDAGGRADQPGRAASEPPDDPHPAAGRQRPGRVVVQAMTAATRPSSPAPEAAWLTPPRAVAPEHLTPQVESIVPAITPRPANAEEGESPLPGRAEPIPAAAHAQSDRAPTIKITIGRVDVRAVMPERPAPPPAPERRQLKLSLEEYLKQRSGGKP